MAQDQDLLSNAAVARRLIAVRQTVAGDNQSKFAAEMGIEVGTWNASERTGNLSRKNAVLLCTKIPGLTLDWLYRGVEDGLPVGLHRSLAAVETNLTSVGLRG